MKVKKKPSIFKARKKYDPKRGRLAEIGKIVRDRRVTFKEDDAIIMLAFAFHFIKPIRGDMEFAMENWCEMNKMGRPTKDIIREVMAECKNTEPIWNAEEAGRYIRLTYDERRRLRIRTIFCCDKTRAEVEEIQRIEKNAKSREARRAARLAEGRMPREEYERLAQAKRDAIAALGMSKNQFYYQQRKRRIAMGAA
jgi:hypothetical protein